MGLIKFNKSFWREVGILSIFAVIFGILTYPLLIHFTNSIIGSKTSDAPIFLWNAWHMSKSLKSLTFSGSTNLILFPYPVSLLTHTYTEVNSLCIAFLNLIIGNLIISFNTYFLFSTVLTAYLSYRFFLLISRCRAAAIIGSITFTFGPMWSIYVSLGTQNLITLWFIPLALLAYELWRRSHNHLYGIIIGFAIATGLINDIYTGAFVTVGLVIYILTTIIIDRKEKVSKLLALAGVTLGAAAVFMLKKIISLIPQLSILKKIPFPTLMDVDYYHADIINLFRPAQFHPIWGMWHNWWTEQAITNGNSFIGFTVIFIILVCLILLILKRNNFNQQRMFFVFGVSFLIVVFLSFGPFFHFFGKATNAPMPYYFIDYVSPLIRNLRVPMRWLLLAQFFTAGLVAILVSYILANVRLWWRYFLLVLFILGLIIDVAFLPRPIIQLNTARTAALKYISQSLPSGPVLNIPFSANSGYETLGTSTRIALAHQTIHTQPIIGGHASRILPEIMSNYINDPIISYLADYQRKPVDSITSDEIIKFNNTFQPKFILIDREDIDEKTDTYRALSQFLTNKLGFIQSWQDDFFTIYKKYP